MSAPLYFLPGVNRAQLLPGGRLNRSLLESRGLADVLADVDSLDDLGVAELAGPGPGGRTGTIFTALPVASRSAPRRVGFFPADQEITWQACAGGETWIALDRAFPPTPADLARRTQLAGYDLLLGDGQSWHVPVIRRPVGPEERRCRLPRSYGWDAAGKFLELPRPGYEEHWLRSAQTFQAIFNGAVVDLEWAIETAVLALALNYRLGRFEQTLLGLVDSQNYRDLLGITVDTPLVRELAAEVEAAQKKTSPQPAPWSSAPGVAAGSPSTAPAAPSLPTSSRPTAGPE